MKSKIRFHLFFQALIFTLIVIHQTTALAIINSPVPPKALAQNILGREVFEADHLAWYRFNVNPEWKDTLRVNIGPGEFIPLANRTFGVFENRYFFLKLNPNQLWEALDLPKVFSKSKDVRFSNLRTISPYSQSFTLDVDASRMLATIKVHCQGEATISGPHESTHSRYLRYQIHVQNCVLNGSDEVVKESWITLDNYEFDNHSNKTGLQVRSLYVANEFSKMGQRISGDKLKDLALSMSDTLILGILSKLGLQVDKSFVWKHQK